MYDRLIRPSMLLAAFLFVAAGCAGVSLNGEQAAADLEAEATAEAAALAERAPVHLVWPPAPEIPRVRYLHDISSATDIGIRPGLMRRLLRFLKGGDERTVTRSHGIAVDAEGRLYAVDTFHQRVHVFDRVSESHTLFPNRAPEAFKNPIGVAAGAGGRVYVSDSVENVVHVFSDHGRRYERSIGAGVLERPTGLAFDAAGNRLLVTDTLASVLVVFDAGTLELLERVGSEGDRLLGPTHVAVGQDGSILVTDALNFRVQVLDRDLRPVRTFGMPGNAPGQFSRPKGIAMDSAGHIYVVDALFANVQIFDAEGQLLLAFGRPGTGPGEFWLPNDIFIDGQDRIYVSDSYNQRLQVFQYLDHERAMQ